MALSTHILILTVLTTLKSKTIILYHSSHQCLWAASGGLCILDLDKACYLVLITEWGKYKMTGHLPGVGEWRPDFLPATWRSWTRRSKQDLSVSALWSPYLGWPIWKNHLNWHVGLCYLLNSPSSFCSLLNSPTNQCHCLHSSAG